MRSILLKRVEFFGLVLVLLAGLLIVPPVTLANAATPIIELVNNHRVENDVENCMGTGCEHHSDAQAAVSMLQYSSGGHVLGFAPNKVYLAGLDHALTVEFVGGQSVAPVGVEAPTAFIQKDSAPALERVTYPNAWQGVDVTYTADERGLAESTYIVQPGAHPADIRLKYNTPVELMQDGTLRFAFETGYMTESAPVAFQEINNRYIVVPVYFTVIEGIVSFELGEYDLNYPLTIDPIYSWHTFYGGSGIDYGRAITHDGNGNIYVTGHSTVTWNGPEAVAPLNAHTGGQDIVVVKLNSAGAYQWHTFYGSSSSDVGDGITSDGSGNIYVTGFSYATWNGSGAVAPLHAYSGASDIVVVKLNSAGIYQWHTFYGSSNSDYSSDITSDETGNIYGIGESNATWNGPGAVSPLHAYTGGYEIVVFKLTSAGAYQWHTFYGGTFDDFGRAITTDESENIYIY